ncbi:MAG: hypothetical protein RI885_418 [Actinomycetota bacterium]
MRALRLFAAVAAAAVLAVMPVSAASAHDRLVASSPAADETVTVELAAVTLTLSDVPLAGAPAAIQVTDAAGASITNGEVTASDRSVSVEVTPTEPGLHTVAWQVVSSDAHTISGEYSFTYAGPVAPSAPAASPSPAAGSSAEPDPSPTDQPTNTVEPTPTTAPTAQTSASIGAFLPLIIAVLAAIVIAIVAAVWRANVARDKTDDTDAVRDDHGGPPRV